MFYQPKRSMRSKVASKKSLQLFLAGKSKSQKKLQAMKKAKKQQKNEIIT